MTKPSTIIKRYEADQDEADGRYSVIRFSDGKELFSGGRTTCIRFIKGFDLGSSKYVDLRLIDPYGDEDNWHN